ncbi:MAG: hypothetical protein CMI09_15630 [Oceanospirillaceae bacterium]|nr:hypothetical protein [Oceanospirillaceae bacterium]
MKQILFVEPENHFYLGSRCGRLLLPGFQRLALLFVVFPFHGMTSFTLLDVPDIGLITAFVEAILLHSVIHLLIGTGIQTHTSRRYYQHEYFVTIFHECP